MTMRRIYFQLQSPKMSLSATDTHFQESEWKMQAEENSFAKVKIERCNFTGIVHGAAVDVTSITKVLILDSTFSNLQSPHHLVFAVRGRNSSLLMNGVSLTGNHVGSIHAANSTINLSNSFFENNVATSDNQSNLFVQNSDLIIRNSNFINNTFARGGVFQLSQAFEVNVSGCSFLYNQAHIQGGVLATDNFFSARRHVAFHHCTLRQNSAEKRGGAIFVHNTTVLNHATSTQIKSWVQMKKQIMLSSQQPATVLAVEGFTQKTRS